MKKTTAIMFLVMSLSAVCGLAVAKDTTQGASYDETGHSSKNVFAAECTKENYDPKSENCKKK
ncbi:hypothetical protein [Pseudomonas sp. URMO17WK12:I12]|jgi:hypothetical protein|uniref:hypothetical protein n=1 Tax=Pseudomonas sp. URMO17WK12:I12 TaxID=1259797 RepID=UPI0012DF7DF9|nr:hypothetical protein [Pseudomonas sp. URMO17WK12:I12]